MLGEEEQEKPPQKVYFYLCVSLYDRVWGRQQRHVISSTALYIVVVDVIVTIVIVVLVTVFSLT